MRFIIDRSKWARGRAGSRLYRASGKSCCMGMVALQCGASRNDILDKPTIASVPKQIPGLPLNFVLNRCSDAPWVREAYDINDDRHTPDSTREAQLTSLAAANGHEFVFVDSSPAVVETPGKGEGES